MRVMLALVAVGCGRIGFGARTDATSDAVGVEIDAARPRCNDPAVPPPTLTISGTVFRYTSFTTTTPIPGATATLVDGTASEPSATANAQGAYSLSIPTHGAPLPGKLAFTNTNDAAVFTTTVWLDGPLTRDLVGSPTTAYIVGPDAPVWNSGAMTLVYQSTGITEDAAAGSLNIEPVDCAGNGVAGVSVTVTPPPAQLGYIDMNGHPDPNASATSDPFPVVFCANAVAGPTHITFSGAGLRWPEIDLDVLAGSNNTVAVVRGD
ncbi:MAG: hypothetical protein JO257_35835 [Deltaproteobacteria bacterium]|nr:hypothetical protein [Deltaproteobacteria bacterium]